MPREIHALPSSGFNPLLNHPTFSAPNLAATNAAFGTITAAANRPRRVHLGARLVF